MPMLTEQLLEHWNIDSDVLGRQVESMAPEGDLFFGGSLADDLGNPGSDIDLYHFIPGPAEVPDGPTHLSCQGLTIELHLVDVSAAEGAFPDLRALLTSDDPASPGQLPLLSGRSVRVLYALYCDRRLAGDGSTAERLRRRTGADLLHVHLALRSALTTLALLDDVRLFTAPEHLWARLYCARLLVESAIDAALASVGLVNPNPKWRMTLAERAVLIHPAFPALSRLLPALFPDTGRPDEAIDRCVVTARACLERVYADGLLASYPVVPQALEAVDAYCATRTPGGPDGR